VVLSKTKPFPIPPSEKAFSAAKLQKAWNETQNELPALEPNTPHIIATGSRAAGRWGNCLMRMY
jgi:hypothetical protein